MRLAACILIGLAAAAGAGAAQSPCPAAFDEIDALLAQIVDGYALQGCSLRLIRGGETIYERSLGTYSGEEVVPTAAAASWITATVAMVLVDQRLLHLDDTTADWLGWTGEKGTITLRQLLSHTSGLRGGDAPCLRDPDTTLAACVESIYALPLVATPGTEFHLGGNAPQVAARMCEVAAGQPFVELYDNLVRAPLQLTDTLYTSATNPRVAGGCVTTLRDYSRLCEMLLADGMVAGVPLLSPESVDEILADQTRGALPITVPMCVGEFHGYGLGNWVRAVDDSGRTTESSSPGGLRLTPWIDRPRRLTGVFVTVTTADICPQLDQLRQRIRDILDRRHAGDMNCDGRVDFDDIDPFILALADPAGYAAAYPGCDARNADCDCSGRVEFEDIDAFLARLGS